MNLRLHTLLRLGLFLSAGLLTFPATAQEELRDERGDPEAERKTILDGNRVGLTLFNHGLSGGIGEVRGNWPFGSNDFYLGDLMLVVGSEVTDTFGQRVPIISVPRGPGNRGIPSDPNTGEAWTFEAVPGYAAEGIDPRTGQPFAMPARSDDPLAWPALWPDRLEDASDPGWPGAWDGLLGKDAFIDGVEVYSHLADDAVRTQSYFPDPDDDARRGLGLVVEQRVLAWKDPALQDALVYVWDINNATPTALGETYAGLVVGTLIGGDGDSQDDVAGHDLARGLVYAYDFDNSGNQGQPVGVMGVAMLPVNGAAGLDLRSALHFYPSNAFPLSGAQRVWDAMTSGTLFPQDDCLAWGGCDGDLFAASEAFTLPAFSTQRFVAAVVFGETLNALRARVDVLRAFARQGFVLDDDLVTVTAPAAGTQVVGSTVEVAWETTAPGLAVSLDYSDDLGQTWAPVAFGLADSGAYTWDVSGLPDGAYLVRVTAYGNGRIGGASSGVFTIDRDGANLPPVVALGALPGIAAGTVPVTWQAVDPDGDPVAVRLVAEAPGGLDVPLADGLPASGTYDWDTTPLPNGFYHLRVEATDGAATATQTSDRFTVDNPRQGLDPDAYTQYIGRGDGVVEVRVADPEAVTGHRYRVAFTGGPIAADAYSVLDETAGTTVVASAPLLDVVNEGPLFDGLRLAVLSPSTDVDSDETGWADPVGLTETFTDVINVVEWRYTGVAVPYDYEVRFDDDLVGQSIGGFFLGIPAFGAPMAVAKQTNFTVRNTSLDRDAEFVFYEPEATEDGRFEDYGEIIFIYETLDGERTPTYMMRGRVNGDGTPTGAFPGEGDVFVLRTVKAIQDGDAFVFDALLATAAEAPPEAAVLTLDAPAPNPVAGRTTLRFALPGAGPVRLRVFDLLGREVASLLDGERTAGAHALAVETAGFAAGLYLVRLEWDGQAATRRLLVVR